MDNTGGNRYISREMLYRSTNDEIENLIEEANSETVLFSGSAALNSSITLTESFRNFRELIFYAGSDFYGRVLEVIPDYVKIIVDTEKNNMLSALKNREIFMVKPNVPELEKFSDMKVNDKFDMVKAAKKYIDAGAKNVLVSMGADGAVLTDGKDNYYCKSASVAVNSTVGAGDSMLAAACVGLIHGVPMQELLRRSVAAGTAAVTTSGTNLFYRDKYNEIYSKVFAERF